MNPISIVAQEMAGEGFTVRGLATRAGCSERRSRETVQQLIAQGLVQPEGFHRTGQRGRPSLIFKKPIGA